MAGNKRYVNWKRVEAVIAEDPNRPRKEIAKICGVSVYTHSFRVLCNNYGVPNTTGKGRAKAADIIDYDPPQRPTRKAKTYFVKCPTCEKWWEHRSDLKPDSNRMYCHAHEYARRNSADQNALYNAGIK